MKILFSITYYHPYVSGLTLAAARWAEGLRTKGHIVHVLCMSGSGKGVIQAKPILKISKGFLSWDFVTKSWDQVQKHDVVVVNLPQFEGWIPALFGKIFNKKIIAIYHCEVILPGGFVNSVVQGVLEISNFLMLLLSHSVVVYTRDYGDSSRVLRSLRVLKKKIKIHYIVPPIPKPKENAALTKKLQKKIGHGEFVIGIAARLAAEKGIEYLLEASANIPGKVVIAGPMEPVGEDAYKEKIMRLVKKYNRRVVFLGSIAPDQMGSFYRLIDVLVLPSVNSTEAFGMVQVEAMRWGVPVVASNLPGVRVPIQKTGMGLVVPSKDPKELADAITSVMAHRDTYQKDVAKLWTPESSVRAFERICTP